MAGTMKIEGMADISEMLTKLGEKAQGVAGKGLYEGAGVMADEIRNGAAGIKSEKFHYAVFITRDPSHEEKAAIQDSVGIAKFQKNGSEVNTSIGYSNAGYAEIAGKRKPIPLIANAINSGTSFLKKQPFVRKAASSGAKKAEAAICAKIESEIDQLTK